MQDKWTTLRASVDDSDAKLGTITGVAAAYGKPVQRTETIFEELTAGMFKAQVGAPNRIPVLWQHDMDNPIGRTLKLTDTSDDLKFEARITESEDVPEARKALALLREGIIDEVSVGFEWGTWTEVRDGDKLTIKHTKARLREFSVVTFGALGRDARVITVASEARHQSYAHIRARLALLNS